MAPSLKDKPVGTMEVQGYETLRRLKDRFRQYMSQGCYLEAAQIQLQLRDWEKQMAAPIKHIED